MTDAQQSQAVDDSEARDRAMLHLRLWTRGAHHELAAARSTAQQALTGRQQRQVVAALDGALVSLDVAWDFISADQEARCSAYGQDGSTCARPAGHEGGHVLTTGWTGQ